MSASFVSAMNTRANHFAIDQENKQLKVELALLLKEKEQLKKEIKESEAVEKHLMEILRRTNKYDEALKAHYREGKVVELLIGIPTWVDDDEEEESEAEEESDVVEWCECGEHYVPREMMWPNFADCRECATPKEYAEQMGISIEEAEVVGEAASE